MVLENPWIEATNSLTNHLRVCYKCRVMNKAGKDQWFTVQVRFDREHGALEVSRPHVKEIEIFDGTFYLRDGDGEIIEEADLEEVEWYKVKPQKKDLQPEV